MSMARLACTVSLAALVSAQTLSCGDENICAAGESPATTKSSALLQRSASHGSVQTSKFRHDSDETKPTPALAVNPVFQPEKSFFEICHANTESNKCADNYDRHYYHVLYEKLLKPLRHQPGVKLLEIGLGCNMRNGTASAGGSVAIWKEYFKDVNLWIGEYDEE